MCPKVKLSPCSTPSEDLAAPDGAHENASHFVVKPTGQRVELRHPMALDEAGEWLLEAEIGGVTLFRAAVYVDMDIPSPRFHTSRPAQTDEMRLDQAHQMLSQLHSDFFGDNVVLSREAALDRSAAVALQASMENRKFRASNSDSSGLVCSISSASNRMPRFKPAGLSQHAFLVNTGTLKPPFSRPQSVRLASSAGPRGEWTLMVSLAGD